MSAEDGRQSPDFTFSDDGRGKIERSGPNRKFRVGDDVYLVEGGQTKRYLIASTTSPGRYTLCHHDWSPANNGEEVEESALQAA
ncbi:hypothetical protein EG329_014458 [Mollisiaceae sp. DMI_Dod_QoI]|nr:hypothetical protein EG329_014458 [Helotiales sp. DMI_Dod_QoI]